MRISDWSSDVCSSDLLRVSAGPPGERRRYQHPIILQRVGLLVRVPYDADDPPGERTASIEWTRQVHRRLLAVIGAIFEPHITFRRKLRSLADAVDDAAVRRLSIEHGRWSSQHLDTVQGIHCCPRKGRVAVEIAHAVQKLHRREPTNGPSIIAPFGH